MKVADVYVGGVRLRIIKGSGMGIEDVMVSPGPGKVIALGPYGMGMFMSNQERHRLFVYRWPQGNPPTEIDIRIKGGR